MIISKKKNIKLGKLINNDIIIIPPNKHSTDNTWTTEPENIDCPRKKPLKEEAQCRGSALEIASNCK